MWKDFFYFSREERRGIIILAGCIIVVAACAWFTSTRNENKAEKEDNSEKENKEYADFIHSLKKRKRSTRYAKYTRYEPREIRLAPFDPNLADSAAFVGLGLPPWMARNILRYRAKGGKFRKPQEFRKVYGLTQAQYSSLLPYIYISEDFSKRDTLPTLFRRDAADSLKTYKYVAGTTIGLNLSDTTELKKIPGIGSGIARMIAGYRKQLGGFYRIEQLQEIRLDVDRLRPWLYVESNRTRRININKASLEHLKAHPYINFYQAKVIVEHREKNGALKNLKQLALYEEFTPRDLERISHYICFE
ncbi:helix-hairpin-helix domain-containing protein [uncultured Bacteroides sp.]|uniref:ComEA family DNA-binding protein n=1 Tax=uncultured Bacteroides sp. TaxID=162156 RepID=UPI002AA7B61C|nr:helix-hairpin-helix domain-containing protein [uncultured Bacteroides sp.]